MKLSSFHQFSAFHLFVLGWLLLLPGCGDSNSQSSENQSSLLSSDPSDGNVSSIPDTSQIHSDYTMMYASYYSGSCDGSGGIALDAKHFAVVNDETSLLLIYQRNEPGAPVQSINLRKALELKKREEADLEGLARMGNYLFVLGSHSRDREGNKQKERRKLLALRILSGEGGFDLKPVGDVYEDLMDDLEDQDAFEDLDLKKSAKESGDDPEGFNIEGLCAGEDGVLWLCFRGPRIRNRALLIPIINPEDVMVGARARFGKHLLLDLQGRTIRGADYFEGQIVLVTDSDLDGLGPALFLWDGKSEEATLLHTPELRSIDPESVILFPNTGLQELLILSDDGGRRLSGKDCKDLKNESEKRFRTITYQWRSPQR